MMLERLRYAMHGFKEGWQNGGNGFVSDADTRNQGYELRWSLYEGTAFQDLIHRNPYRNDQRIYKNTVLLWKHVEAIVEFYAANVYRGELPSKAPTGVTEMKGAIPFIIQTPDSHRDDLLKAIVELFIGWNWQMQMSQRPLYGAALGNILTELVDDLDRGFVYPQTIWPGYVVSAETDYVDNVKSYVLEYPSERKIGGTVERFTLRKEVDKESFRYFKGSGDSKQPYDATGAGPVVPNPYGFVPAIWDTHRVGRPGSVYGRSAIDGTIATLMQVNSIFSHAFDFQRKAFYAPMMVAGKAPAKRDGEIDTSPQGDKPEDYAQEYRMAKVPEGATLLQPQFDIGKTLDMLKEIQQGIVDENPEARFYQQLRGMATVATETAKILTEDAGSRLRSASDRYDSNTVKLFQMAIAMCGFRVQRGDWGKDTDGRSRKMSQRQLAFARFDLESFKRGEMDMNIATRDLIEPTEQERLNRIRQTELIQTPWGFSQVGVEEDIAKTIIAARVANQWQAMNGGSYADFITVEE